MLPVVITGLVIAGLVAAWAIVVWRSGPHLHDPNRTAHGNRHQRTENPDWFPGHGGGGGLGGF